MKPIRVQRKRTKGWKMPENTVYVGRPTRWGNPFKVGEHYECTAWLAVMFDYREFIKFYIDGITPNTVDEAVRLYRKSIEAKFKLWNTTMQEEIKLLKGKNLACFCPLDKPCHADVLLELANEEN